MNEITPASLRMFSSGPDGFLWRCADAWEEDVSDVCTINAELNGVIIRQQKRIEVLERALRQCERAVRMPWLNTYEESARALELIDRALEEKP
ncbi:MAG TPA: hypothetical protein VJA25_05445 [Dehalococcoidia bacterium]|nr:hypothetical protein [Dehalococcoidia bacterium]